MTIFRMLTILALVPLAACKLGEFGDAGAQTAEAATRPVPLPVSTGVAPEAPGVAVAALEDPETLIGIDERTTLARLGEPDSIDRQSQAHLWHYAVRPSCELVLYLYVDMTTRTRHVLAYENRPVPGAAGPGCGASRTAARN